MSNYEGLDSTPTKTSTYKFQVNELYKQSIKDLPEKNLVICIILQAIKDCSRKKLNPSSSKFKYHLNDFATAKDFINSKNKQFLHCCSLIEFNPGQIISYVESSKRFLSNLAIYKSTRLYTSN